MQVMSRQRGVSLIEVLVAIVIFSVGVLKFWTSAAVLIHVDV
jgi:prepilin-type N-terminal cleavage/methylation domain-containing protein